MEPISLVRTDPAGRLRVLLVASHPIVRSGLARLLEERENLALVGQVADLAAARLAGETDAILVVPGSTLDLAEVGKLAEELSAPVVLIGEDSSSPDLNALAAI